MKTATSKAITKIYREVEEEFDEHSTAFLLEVTAERARLSGIKSDCDCSDVADALIKEGVYK